MTTALTSRYTAQDTDPTAIRPFQVEIPQADLDDLQQRLVATRFPSQELVEDRSQGVQLATLRELARYWSTEYDWRACEARLNALPQFTTEIDGVDIHFIHVRSPHEHALPLIMTHGWPGSVVELLETVGPLTDPTAHGGDAEDAFHLVLPSIPGYGFSGEPAEVGWDAARIGQAWAELMRRIGYTRYQDLRMDLTREVTRENLENTTFPAVSGDIDRADSLEDIVAKVALNETLSIGDTVKTLDIDALGIAVQAVLGAARVDIFGVGASSVVALDLQQKLTRIGRTAGPQ